MDARFLSMLIALAIAGVADAALKSQPVALVRLVKIEQVFESVALQFKFSRVSVGSRRGIYRVFRRPIVRELADRPRLLADPAPNRLLSDYIGAHYLSDVVFAAILGVPLRFAYGAASSPNRRSKSQIGN